MYFTFCLKTTKQCKNIVKYWTHCRTLETVMHSNTL